MEKQGINKEIAPEVSPSSWAEFWAGQGGRPFLQPELVIRHAQVPICELFDFEGGDRADPERARLMSTLVEIARTLSMENLEIAVRQLSALEKGSS